MKKRERVKGFIEKYGVPCQIIREAGGDLFINAIIQPLLYKNKLYVELQPSEVGRVDDGCCRYIGPSEVEFLPDTGIVAEGKLFTAERFEQVYLEGEVLYCRAILRPQVIGEEN